MPNLSTSTRHIPKTRSIPSQSPSVFRQKYRNTPAHIGTISCIYVYIYPLCLDPWRSSSQPKCRHPTQSAILQYLQKRPVPAFAALCACCVRTRPSTVYSSTTQTATTPPTSTTATASTRTPSCPTAWTSTRSSTPSASRSTARCRSSTTSTSTRRARCSRRPRRAR